MRVLGRQLSWGGSLGTEAWGGKCGNIQGLASLCMPGSDRKCKGFGGRHSAKGKLGSPTCKEAGSWDVGDDGGKGDVCFKKIPNLVLFVNSGLLWEVDGLGRKTMWLGSSWLDSCCWWQVSNISPRLSFLLESQGLPWCLSDKETACQCKRH